MSNVYISVLSRRNQPNQAASPGWPCPWHVQFENVLTFSNVGISLASAKQERIGTVETANAIKATLLFPLLDNDGDPFDRETWSWFQDQLVGLSDLGFDFTELGRTEGSWRGHSDRCRWIVTVVRTEEQVEEIRRFLREARDKFRQEVMYLDYHPVRLELVK